MVSKGAKESAFVIEAQTPDGEVSDGVAFIILNPHFKNHRSTSVREFQTLGQVVVSLETHRQEALNAPSHEVTEPVIVSQNVNLGLSSGHRLNVALEFVGESVASPTSPVVQFNLHTIQDELGIVVAQEHEVRPPLCKGRTEVRPSSLTEGETVIPVDEVGADTVHPRVVLGAIRQLVVKPECQQVVELTFVDTTASGQVASVDDFHNAFGAKPLVGTVQFVQRASLVAQVGVGHNANAKHPRFAWARDDHPLTFRFEKGSQISHSETLGSQEFVSRLFVFHL